MSFYYFYYYYLRPGHTALDNENENKNAKNLDNDWLNKRGRILLWSIQPIEGLYFYHFRFQSRYRGLCDRAFTIKLKIAWNVDTLYCASTLYLKIIWLGY